MKIAVKNLSGLAALLLFAAATLASLKLSRALRKCTGGRRRKAGVYDKASQRAGKSLPAIAVVYTPGGESPVTIMQEVCMPMCLRARSDLKTLPRARPSFIQPGRKLLRVSRQRTSCE